MTHDKGRPPPDGKKPTPKPRSAGESTGPQTHGGAPKPAQADDLRTGHATPGDGGDNKIKK
jgi:hypothetical protein